MPYTFGAGTGDDITWSPALNVGQTASQLFVYGWWYPTTLTATRGLWSIGNIVGAEIDATTSAIRLRSDNTTDGQWTAPVGLVVNEWKFLAFVATFNNTGPAATWKVWAGDVSNPPTAITVTQATAPVGNFVGTTTFTAGNKGTGTLAFQGDIAHLGIVATDGGVGSRGPFNNETGGAISAGEEEYLFHRFVWNAWNARYPWLQGGSHCVARPGTAGTGVYAWHFNLDLGALGVGYTPSAATTTPLPFDALNGATVSSRDDPRNTLGSPDHQYVRR